MFPELTPEYQQHFAHLQEHHKSKTHCTDYKSHIGYQDFHKNLIRNSTQINNIKFPCYMCAKEGNDSEQICLSILMPFKNTKFNAQNLLDLNILKIMPEGSEFIEDKSDTTHSVKRKIGKAIAAKIKEDSFIKFQDIIDIVFENTNQESDVSDSEKINMLNRFSTEELPHIYYHLCIDKVEHDRYKSLTTLNTLLNDTDFYPNN